MPCYRAGENLKLKKLNARLLAEANTLKKENVRLRAEAERVKQIRRAEANQKFAEFEAKKNRAARQARCEKARRPT